MAFEKLKLFFGLVPGIEEAETKRAALQKEFEEFNEFAQSDELQHFEELEKFVHSDEFQERKKAIMEQKYSDTEEFQKEQRYNELRKSSLMKNYFKVKASPKLQELQQTEQAGTPEEFEQLDKEINSPEFNEKKNSMKSSEFKETDEYQKLQRHKELKKSKPLKDYYKFKNSDQYKQYLEVEGSDMLKEYKELEEFVSSEDFHKVKSYMLLSPKKKYLQSDEYAKLQEYNQLKKSDKIIRYYKLRESDKFDEIKRWKLTFEDDFDNNKLDTDKWITKHYYGEAVVNTSYSQDNELQYYTDGDNIELDSSNLKIITRKEQAQGNSWNPKFGFHVRQYDYTSGLVNTGNSFRQQFGLFEVKVKINPPFNLAHAFWMLSEKILPQINVFKFEKKKFQVGHIWGSIDSKRNINKQLSKINASKFAGNYVIFSLEWTPEQMVWKINDMKALTQKKEIPQEPMYLILSSGIFRNNFSEEELPGEMDVDWVRCYEEQEIGS